ncbi:hypothetical protein AAF712_013594 [Marasmius tenuissimus]|uniref:Uncharacterized protein n=1 Tax=Marasmius tenuissimus TaxID=585030 RepID=A0ABR2ZEI2_9AGAR
MAHLSPNPGEPGHCLCGCSESDHVDAQLPPPLPSKGGIPGGPASRFTSCTQCNNSWIRHLNDDSPTTNSMPASQASTTSSFPAYSQLSSSFSSQSSSLPLSSLPPPQTTSFYRNNVPISAWRGTPGHSTGTTSSAFSSRTPAQSIPTGAAASSSSSSDPASYTTPFVSTTPVLRNISNPRGSARTNAFTITADSVKGKAKSTKVKANDPPYTTIQMDRVNGGFFQEVAVLILGYHPSATFLPDHDNLTITPRILTAYQTTQMETAAQLSHIVEFRINVQNPATDNVYPAVYGTIVQHFSDRGILFGGEPLSPDAPLSSPFILCKLGRKSTPKNAPEGATICVTDTNTKWTLDGLNQTTSDCSIKPHYKNKLVVFLAPKHIMHGPHSSGEPHPCYGFKFNHAFMDTSDSQSALPELECLPSCPGQGNLSGEEEEIKYENESQEQEEVESVFTGSRRGRPTTVTITRRVRRRLYSPSPEPNPSASERLGISPSPSSSSSLPPVNLFWDLPPLPFTALPGSRSPSPSAPSPSAQVVEELLSQQRNRSPSVEYLATVPAPNVDPVPRGIPQTAPGFLHAVSDRYSFDETRPGIKMTATSTRSAAWALIECLRCHHSGEPIPRTVSDPNDSDGFAVINNFVFDRLLCHWSLIEINPGAGDGVLKNVIRQCIETMASNDELFRPIHDGLVTWAFSPGSTTPERIVWAKVTGSLMALHLAWLKSTPHPFDPIYTALMVVSFDVVKALEYVNTIHPDLGHQLAIWPDFDNKNTTFASTDQSVRNGLQYLVNTFFWNLTLPQVRNISTRLDWDIQTDKLKAQALFATTPESLISEEVDAARKGFRGMKVDPGVYLSDLLNEDNAYTIITELCAKEVKDPKSVIKITTYPSPFSVWEDADFLTAFKCRFAKYIRGQGHPKTLVRENLLSAKDLEQAASNMSCYRAEMFLKMATGVKLVPHPFEGRSSHIKMSFLRIIPPPPPSSEESRQLESEVASEAEESFLPSVTASDLTASGSSTTGTSSTIARTRRNTKPLPHAGQIIASHCARTVTIHVNDNLIAMVKDIPEDLDSSDCEDDIFADFFHKNIIAISGESDYQAR